MDITRDDKLVFLDVETTGVAETDRLCQLAYSTNNGARVALFKPPVPMTVDAMSICHITNEMLEGAPAFAESDARNELQSLFDDDGILVAHNANFDLGFLLKEGMALPKRHICTMKVAHHHDKKGELEKHNLQYLRYLYGLKFEQEINAHDAMGDVWVLEKLFDWYKQHYTIEQMVEISSKPILLKKMPFGKYKGDWFKDIAKKDFDYLLWMRRAMDMDENMKYTVEHYINNR